MSEVAESHKNLSVSNSDRLLRTIRGEECDSPPIWIMRQAGRYLPEFLELRRNHKFFEVCQTPELSAKATIMPLKRFDLDAAIIFSDILVIPQALGMVVEMHDGVGPVLPNPLTVENMNNQIRLGQIATQLGYVGEAIAKTKQLMPRPLPIFGFSGAPWTLMAYMIEGKGTKTCSKAKKWLYAHPEEAHKLLQILTNAIIEYLKMQVAAGADILQVFDSSAEYLNESLYETFGLPYLKQIRDQVVASLGDKRVPMVLFAKGAYFALFEQAELGYEVIGIDWTVPVETINELRRRYPNLIIQGNLDPCALYGSSEQITTMAHKMISSLGPQKYIVNLGHGIYPDTPIEGVEAFVKAVRSHRS